MSHQRHTIGGHTLHVIDGLVAAGDLLQAHAAARMLSFTRIAYGYRADASEELRQDYMWTHLVTPDERTAFPLDTVCAAATGLASLEPRRTHLNCIAAGERRHDHIDAVDDQVWVGVAMLNTRWEPSWGGSLAFRTPDGELTIAHRPGRVLVFPGCMVHRGGVPHDHCVEARYALVQKFVRKAS